MENKTIFAFATTFVLLLAGCGVFLMDGSDTSEGATTHNITVAQGQTWSYSITVNVGTPSYSITGSATSWISLNSSTGTVSGTVPSVGSSDTTLNITATTTQPTQTYTQTITFTIVEGMGMQLGDSVNGVYNYTTHALTVSGTGPMYNWTSQSPSPLEENFLVDQIWSVTINSGVTTIGDRFMVASPGMSMENFTTLNADYVESIGKYAFHGCYGLTGNLLGDMENLTTIGDYAFAMTEITTVYLGDTVTTVGEGAFVSASNGITGLIIGNGLTSINSSAFITFNQSPGDTSTFYEYDGTSITFDASSIRGTIYCAKYNDSTHAMEFYNCLHGTAQSNGYSNDYTYMVAGKSVPNTTEDNILFTAQGSLQTGVTSTTISAILDNILVDDEGIHNASWTLTTAVGSAELGNRYQDDSGYRGTIVSGTAPTSTGTVTSNAVWTLTYYDDCAPATIHFEYGMDFNALVVPVLVITSVPESTA